MARAVKDQADAGGIHGIVDHIHQSGNAYRLTQTQKPPVMPAGQAFPDNLVVTFANIQDEVDKDWNHPKSGAPMIKMQHPDYELFSADSTHYKAGVACADCHMPYTRDGSAKFSTHNVQSPLLNAETACGACHTDVGYVTTRVSIIQNTVNEVLLATEDAIIEAINAIKAAADAGASDEQLAEARNLHRAAQLRWDFVAASNGMGFHNPEEVLRILANATDLARQAQILAIQATP